MSGQIIPPRPPSVDLSDLNLAPTANQFDPGANMADDQFNDWVAIGLANHSLIVFKGSDYPASRLTGIDASDIDDGDVRIFMNLSQSGIDCGQVVLKHDHADSSQDNRILCPGSNDFYVPVYGAVALIYQTSIPGVTGARWIVADSKGRAGQMVMQMMSLYPSLKTVELSGQYDDWNPEGDRTEESIDAGFGVAGGSNKFEDYTLIKCLVNEAGATITGFGGINGSNNLPTDWGPVKIIINYGPGPLTFLHASGDSATEHQLLLPLTKPVILKTGETAMFVAPMQDSLGLDAQWRMIGLGQSSFLTDRVIDTLAAGLTSDYDGAFADVLELTGTAPISYIDGLIPIRVSNDGSSNEIRIIKNVGTVPIAIVDSVDSASSAENQFRLPEPGPTTGATSTAPPMIIPPGSSVAFQYTEHSGDLQWCPLGAGQLLPTLNTGATITPDAWTGVVVNDYDPTDGTTGLHGRWANVWIVQGYPGTYLTGIDTTPGRAFLDVVGPATLCDTVVQAAAPGPGGNAITLAFVNDGSGAGTLNESAFPVIVFHYQSGVTTVANFETAVIASAHLLVKRTGTQANVLTNPGDTFSATNLAGGISIPPFKYGDRVLFTNFSSGMTFKDNDARSLAVNRFRLPGGDVVLGQWGSLEVMWLGAWVISGGKPS